MTGAYDTQERIVHGRLVQVEFVYDNSMGAPWEEHEGHGPVRESGHRHYAHSRADKKPGERPLNNPDHNHHQFYYDWQEAIKIAKRDGWGYIEIDDWMHMLVVHRKQPTKGMIAEHAAQQDFDRLRGWLNDEWQWCGIVVTDMETEIDQSLWGIESDSSESFFEETISDLANEMWLDVCKALLEGGTGRRAQTADHG